MTTLKLLFQKHKQLIPLLILLIYCLRILVTWMDGTVELAGQALAYTPDMKHYAAFAAVALNGLIYFAARRFYKYTLIAALLLGLFGLINFSVLETTSRYSINTFGITVEPSAFFVLILTVVLNAQRAGQLLSGSDKEAEARVSNLDLVRRKEEVEKFKRLFVSKPTEELIRLRDDPRSSEFAKEAAGSLLADRG